MGFMRLALGSVAASAVVVVGLAPSLPADSGSPLPPSFEVVAAADGLRVTTTIPGAPLSDNLIDVSSGSAQSVVDAVGVSRAFAALPYPGATLTNLLDVLRGATGAPIPSYPLIAASDHPAVPESTVGAPGVTLTARSEAGMAESKLAAGPGDDSTAALRSVGDTHASAVPDGTLTAEATSVTAGLQIGPLQLGRVTSRAKVVRTSTGEPRREQSLEVTGVSVSGQSLGIGPQGLTLGSTGVPLPDSHPVRAVLEQAGIAIQYLEPVETPDGVLSAGFTISQVVPASPTGSASRVTYTAGRTRAGVVVGAATPDATNPPPGPPTGTEGSDPDAAAPPASAPAGSSGTDATAAPAGPASASRTPVGSTPDGPLPGVPAAHTVGTVPVPPGGPSPAWGGTSAAAAAGRGGPTTPPMQALLAAAPGRVAEVPSPGALSGGSYAVLLGAGGVLVLAFLAIRSLGVKSTWVS